MLLPDTHEYLGCISGLKRSSVTTILAAEGYIPKRFYREGFAELGTQVHRLINAYNKHLKFKAPDIYLRYLKPWQQFLAHLNADVIDSEVEVEEPMLGYGGQLDTLLRVPGHGVGLLDIKVSSCGYMPAHDYQTEGYRAALVWHPVYKDLRIDWRGGIILGPDCNMPRLINHDRIQGVERIWQSIVTVYHDKIRHKVEMEEISQENGYW